MFGSIFLLIQFFQTVQGYSPLQAGLRILPWTAMPIFIAPIAGAWSDRIGGQRLMAAGPALQAGRAPLVPAAFPPPTPAFPGVAPVFPPRDGRGGLFSRGRRGAGGVRRPVR